MSEFDHGDLCEIAASAVASHLMDESGWLLWEDWPSLSESEFAELNDIVMGVGRAMADEIDRNSDACRTIKRAGTA